MHRVMIERTTILSPVRDRSHKKMPIPPLPSPEPICIVSLDIGSVWGITAYEQKGPKQAYAFYTVKVKDKMKCFEVVSHLFQHYKPDLVLTTFPVRFYTTIVAHSKQLGIIDLVAEQHETPVIEMNESHAKKLIFNTNKVSKEDVEKYYGVDVSHCADSALFLHAYILSVMKQ